MSPHGTGVVSQDELQLDKNVITALNQLRNLVKDCHLPDSSDDFLITWLKARNYNADEAQKMLRQSLEWRRVNDVDNILQTWTSPEVMQKYYSCSSMGTKDKSGCQVWFSAIGRIDMKGIMQSVTRKDYVRDMIWWTEKAKHQWRLEQERTGDQRPFRNTIIADSEQLGLSRLANRHLLEADFEKIKTYDTNYPHTLRRIFVINASKISILFHKLVVPFLDKNVVDQIRMFGTNREEWKAALLEEIDADQLPAYYGGTMTDDNGDPKCLSKWNMGGEVPSHYFLSNNLPVAKENMQTISVRGGAGGWKKIKLMVENINSILQLEFMSENGDIAYRVYHKCPSKGETELLPLQRVDSHRMMQKYEATCSSLGEYVIQFDNTYSYFHTKKVHYSAVIIDPRHQSS